MIMIYYWDYYNGGHREHTLLKYILWARDIKSMLLVFNCNYITFKDMQTFFLVSCLGNKSLSYKWVPSILRQFWMILSTDK